MIIAIAGATGLTGSLCLKYLLEEPTVSKVIAIGRKQTGTIHPKFSDVLLVDNKITELVIANAFISCLGTTIKKAGSAVAFGEIDFQLPTYLAKELYKQGCSTAAVISAMGANPSSSFLYTKTKGLMEVAMTDIGFESLSILRPSFIIGNRNEKRAGEIGAVLLLKMVNPLLIGNLSRYKAVSAEAVAATLVNSVIQKKQGVNILFHNQIKL